MTIAPCAQPQTATPDRDVRHTYHGFWTPGALCRIRIYQRDRVLPVVIATQLPENENTSITNLVEQVAAEVMVRYLGCRPFVWVEHYPPRPYFGESYHLVQFDDYVPRPQFSMGRAVSIKIGAPTWRRITRAAVADLIGGNP